MPPSSDALRDALHQSEHFDLLPFFWQTVLTLLAVYALYALVEWVRETRRMR